MRRLSYCPTCGTHAHHRGDEVPAHSRIYTDSDGAECEDFMPELLDFVCDNCGSEWAMDSAEPTP